MAKYVTEDNLVRYTNAIKANATILNRSTAYAVGDIVQKGNVFLKCIKSGTTTATALTLSSVINTVLTDGTVKWQVIDPFAETKVRNWESGVKYEVSRIVKHNGSLYRCLVTNNDTSFTVSNWELLVTGITDWSSGDDYVVGQFVIYNGAMYECITSNNDTTFDPSNWQKVGGGGLDTWAANTDYSVGDIVIHANKIYQCNTSHTSGSTFTPDASNWTEISACITRIPNWEVGTDYVVGDLVSYDRKIYRCIIAHTSDATQWDDTEEANWEELSPTINEISTWAASTDYAVGQLVIHNNKLYRCNTAHTSDSTSFNTDIAYWDEISGSGGIEPWKQNELYTQGSMVVRSNRIYVCDTSHTSGTTFDNSKWHQIATSNILTWAANMPYVVGDTVIYNGQLYRCITAHTANTFNNETANWQVLDTKWFARNWAASTLYFANSVIVYNGTIYRANTTHVSGTSFEADKSKWDVLNANIRTWAAGVSYKVGDIVLKDKELLRCKVANADSGYKGQNWELISRCHTGVWKAGPDPDILALLHFEIAADPGYNEYGASFTNLPSEGGGYFKTTSGGKWGSCGALTGPATGGSTSMNDAARLRSPVYSFNNGETYTVEFWLRTQGDGFYDHKFGYIDSLGTLLSLKGILFPNESYAHDLGIDVRPWRHYAYVITPTTCTVFVDGTQVHSFTRPNSNPIYLQHWSDNWADSTYGQGWVDEIRITKRAVYTSNFTPQTAPFTSPYFDGYEVGDIVVYNDRIYRCIVANSDMEFTPSKWVEISKADLLLWVTNTSYGVGNNVIYNGVIYRCITSHTSGTNFDPSKWTPLSDTIKDWANKTPYNQGQVVKYDGELWRCKLTHTSSSTNTPTNIQVYSSAAMNIDDTTTIPYEEVIDLGDTFDLCDITSNELETEMQAYYHFEISEDGTTYTKWEGKGTAQFVKIVVDQTVIDEGATSPSAYLDVLNIYADSKNWEKVNDHITFSQIDELFI